MAFVNTLRWHWTRMTSTQSHFEGEDVELGDKHFFMGLFQHYIDTASQAGFPHFPPLAELTLVVEILHRPVVWGGLTKILNATIANAEASISQMPKLVQLASESL